MRVSLLTNGTRGDTQPMVVLAAELRRRGHDVSVAASPNTLDLPRACGIEALPFGPDSQALMESEDGQRWLASGNVKAFVKELNAVALAHEQQTLAEGRAATQGADLVVAGILAEDLADALAESAGVPLVTVHSVPVRRTRTYPHPLVSTRSLPGPLNMATGALFETVWWRGAKEQVNLARTELGLAPRKRPVPHTRRDAQALEIQAYDEALAPVPDWNGHRPLVGFLNLDADLRGALGEHGLGTDLEAWLAAGEPPVFFGFGSMPVRDPAAAVRMITDVSRTLGVRALVSAGWGGLAALDPEDDAVRVVGNLDHDAVLGRCRAAVHHGGAGTTAASLGAGLPTVVCAVFADQPFWGARVTATGVGSWLRFADLDADRLGRALRTALAETTVARAREMGQRLSSRREAAVRAVDLIEAVVR